LVFLVTSWQFLVAGKNSRGDYISLDLRQQRGIWRHQLSKNNIHLFEFDSVGQQVNKCVTNKIGRGATLKNCKEWRLFFVQLDIKRSAAVRLVISYFFLIGRAKLLI